MRYRSEYEAWRAHEDRKARYWQLVGFVLTGLFVGLTLVFAWFLLVAVLGMAQ